MQSPDSGGKGVRRFSMLWLPGKHRHTRCGLCGKAAMGKNRCLCPTDETKDFIKWQARLVVLDAGTVYVVQEQKA